MSTSKIGDNASGKINIFPPSQPNTQQLERFDLPQNPNNTNTNNNGNSTGETANSVGSPTTND